MVLGHNCKVWQSFIEGMLSIWVLPPDYKTLGLESNIKIFQNMKKVGKQYPRTIKKRTQTIKKTKAISVEAYRVVRC
jgi:hypothetical protein